MVNKNTQIDLERITHICNQLASRTGDPASFSLLEEVKNITFPYIKEYEELEASRVLQILDFSRTLEAIVNVVFKVKKKEGQSFCYDLFEGKLAKDIGLTTALVKGKSLEELFTYEQAAFFRQKYALAFSGQTISYKHLYKGRYFETTLSPVEENGRVIEIIGSAVEVTSYEEAEQRLEHMASHDHLTNLPNRNRLQKDLRNSTSAGSPFTIIFCNLDRFKYVNDTMGHIAGDQVLLLVAERIQRSLSVKDQLYRLGGDEFVICLMGMHTQSEIVRLGKEILQNIRHPINLLGRQFFITASLGAAQCPKDGSSAARLLTSADVAMHFCKQNGRHNLLFYLPNMNKHYEKVITLEGDLRQALTQNELYLHYQPKVDVRTGYISGMEALVRWKHPEQGLISPAEFIPVAEETGLINQLDEWVLKEACRQNQEWIEQGYAPERMAVNVSANEIQRHDFTENVKQILVESRMDPQYLEIEVTENSVMRNTEQCLQTMQDLKSIGVSLSIDDFGTGYSSLSYLRQFPIHYLKIDRAFIKGVLTDPSDAEMVKAMIQLAEAFKLEVVAEGIEDQEVLDFLKENECAYYQGYHFSKPLPPHEMEKLLVKKQTYS
ncbi:GGDEF-domain containing protein [Halobacillus halophilus]|uniref:Diguanylate cyclase domain protein / diguanylate phosphodiesterase domain protein n=1 Tax=Halobacillus halophilus (strain ATCC 35676 / DSM 2266 / JCM 20832 / KCTC 3685 / LMG 17431 / NBRC 102448 / NCIMB 2269) TaxID=866895 RepID=I0JJ86_HALH3|nr:EAL domain-containing protein [Halobacillus halophilus]ASF38365.1 GGDEF-domain containing protein [Halobacillus halophilus]CCG44204.1 diguanylate cyclase domain protein / diguanylate phosphodiesterase domain protein [Halobacillus halophilus DSM 2266]